MELAGNSQNKETPSLKFDHSVIVHFSKYLSEELDDLHNLELKLIKLIGDSGIGTYDGHEIAMDDTDGTLYMYGTNAESLFKLVLPILQETDFLKGAIATLRFGSYNEEASEIDLEI